MRPIFSARLRFGDGFHHRDDQAQVGGGRLPPRQHARAFLVDADFHGIDLVVAVSDLFAKLAVCFRQRPHRL